MVKTKPNTDKPIFRKVYCILCSLNVFTQPLERDSCTKKYDNVKLVNLVQTNEILLIEKLTDLNIPFEIFG